ncbi:MAG: aldo/keto reductase [Gammaproteobacteria bacterium]|nr:aldo/keto reductase [Gammaproteobacteria bacterium]
MLNRRTLLSAAIIAGLAPGIVLPATTPRMRRIPASGETIPVIGLGTSQTFDVGADTAARDALLPALREFFTQGGTVIDSSPMYGSAEAVTGYLLSRLAPAARPFIATKVWTNGNAAGREQMQASAEHLGVTRVDLMQVHNLQDWRTQLATLREWKATGRIRYIGITTSRAAQYREFESVMRNEALDFVQLNYSAGEREAEETLLPLARERGMAVMVNRPFMRGALFQQVRGKPLPGWAADYHCNSWGQLFLTFALSHPAVTCLIPATSSLRHMTDNMAAGFGREPDAVFRKQLLAELS